ncbi:Macrolide export ATP-binding/permease protein MacB [bioreactor metagenome]|uniref:Macrolide export ATP-binding/permease protein MacB n=1 Tax=bioreactor metagenome TaxID=1076179 RepID=A0A644XT08_9ZZZZ
MKLTEAFQLAVKNIKGNRMRTFLTMLGIIIGIAAVIVIVGLGNGMEKYMRDQFADMGTNTVAVNIMGRGSSRSVSETQMYELVEENPDYFDQISPTVSLSGIVKIGTESLSSTTVTGVSEAYFDMKGYTVSSGRGLQYVDVEKRRNVCVVGNYLNSTYYGGNAVGQMIRLNGKSCLIVGVMTQETDGEMEEGGTDDCVFLPYSTAARMSYTGKISNYTLTVVDETQAAASVTIVEDFLYDIFSDDDAYMVVSMAEMLDAMNAMISVMIGILAGIAAISLVVGGIGIMNIMLVSVTERTREIGIRKALGAKERYIMQQFVMEAATTSALGGVLGITVGYGLSSLATIVVTALMQESLTVSPSIGAVLGAFGISTCIGIVFGYLPAKKAARLNPIDALHYD